VQNPAVGVDRSCFHLYCRQQGKWLPEVIAHDPREDDAWFDRYCPIQSGVLSMMLSPWTWS